MAKESWAPSKKKGEKDGDYKKRYYSAQRTHAEETGDQATTDKIYSKMGKKSHSVDSNKTDKMALGTVAALAGRRLPMAGRVGSEAAGGIKALASGARKALSGGAARKAVTSESRVGAKALGGGVPRQNLGMASARKVASSGGKTAKLKTNLARAAPVAIAGKTKDKEPSKAKPKGKSK